MTEEFHPLNIFSEVERYRLNLSHWRQPEVAYFVTWRLADSLPQSKLRQWREEREAWLRSHHVRSKSDFEKLTEDQRHEYHKRFTARLHQWLDSGMGGCELRQPKFAAQVGETLRRFDGQRYAGSVHHYAQSCACHRFSQQGLAVGANTPHLERIHGHDDQ